LAACIGFLLLLTNFDRTLRDVFSKSRELAFRDFVELKLLVSKKEAVACVNEDESQETKNQCFDYRNIDNQLLFQTIDNKKTFSTILNWQGVPSLQPFVDEVNRRLKKINDEITDARDADSSLDRHKTEMLVFVLIFVACSLAGSAGEAAYQLRLAKAAAIKP
jgi:hypothetical protein